MLHIVSSDFETPITQAQLPSSHLTPIHEMKMYMEMTSELIIFQHMCPLSSWVYMMDHFGYVTGCMCMFPTKGSFLCASGSFIYIQMATLPFPSALDFSSLRR